MSRDMDLVRELLLRLDAIPVGGLYTLTAGQDEEISVPGYDPDLINHHLEMMAKAGFIDAPGSWPGAGGITYRGLTWEGHDFLDTVRDPEVWKRTKEGASKMGGWTFGLLKDLGTAYLKHVAKERLGLDL
jgi:hypothetical protein